jgi:nucleotide-binding universal stress UspA family protein
MIKRILLSYDGSPSSQSALSIACSIAKLTKGELEGLFVEDEARFSKLSLASAIVENFGGEPIARSPLPPADAAAEEAKINEEIAQLKYDFSSACEDAGLEIEFLSLRGDPATIISERAKGVDLVVLGNRGSHHGVEVNPGTTVATILSHTTRPVLVVPDEPLGVSTMVVAYDGSASSQRVLRAAAEIANVMELEEVHLVTVGMTEEEAHQIQAPAFRYLRAYHLHVKPVLLTGKVNEALQKYSDSVDASVIALGAFGSNTLMSRIFGSTVAHMIAQDESAVLLIP